LGFFVSRQGEERTSGKKNANSPLGDKQVFQGKQQSGGERKVTGCKSRVHQRRMYEKSVGAETLKGWKKKKSSNSTPKGKNRVGKGKKSIKTRKKVESGTPENLSCRGAKQQLTKGTGKRRIGREGKKIKKKGGKERLSGRVGAGPRNGHGGGRERPVKKIATKKETQNNNKTKKKKEEEGGGGEKDREVYLQGAIFNHGGQGGPQGERRRPISRGEKSGDNGEGKMLGWVLFMKGKRQRGGSEAPK